MYFEVEDIKRRHQSYTDVYNTNGWIDAPESSVRWKLIRGAIAGTMGGLVAAFSNLGINSYKELRLKYEPPRDVKQWIVYSRSLNKTDFWKRVRIFFY